MATINVTRRKFLKWTGIALGSAILIRTAAPLLKAFTTGGFHHGDELASFIEVSAALIGVPSTELDPKLAQTYWDHLVSYPGAQEQLKILHEKLKSGEISVTPEKHLPESTLAFTKQLIRVWYTGVTEASDGARKRIVYDESLMFKLFSKDRPAPSTCFGAMGSWSKNPHA